MISVSRSKIVAFGSALAVFAIMYFSKVLYTKYHLIMTGDDTTILLVNLDALLAMVVPGYLAAMMLRRNGLINGILVGIMAACVVTIYYAASGLISYFLHEGYGWFLSGPVLGGLGGGIWDLQALVMKHIRSDVKPGT